jgi:hypothetical protein
MHLRLGLPNISTNLLNNVSQSVDECLAHILPKSSSFICCTRWYKAKKTVIIHLIPPHTSPPSSHSFHLLLRPPQSVPHLSLLCPTYSFSSSFLLLLRTSQSAPLIFPSPPHIPPLFMLSFPSVFSFIFSQSLPLLCLHPRPTLPSFSSPSIFFFPFLNLVSFFILLLFPFLVFLFSSPSPPSLS